MRNSGAGAHSSATALGPSISHRDTHADREVIRQVFTDRDYEVSRFTRGNDLERYYRDCDQPLIIDCGANIGAAAVWFAHVYPKAEIVAIEPDADNFALLEQNTTTRNVRPVCGAIAAHSGSVQLVDPGKGEWGYRTIGDGAPIGEVRAYSLGELIALASDREPFILKIDIEGAEGQLFREAPELYSRFPLVIVELHDWLLPGQGTSQPFLEWQASQDRDFVHHGENIFSFCNRRLPRLSEA